MYSHHFHAELGSFLKHRALLCDNDSFTSWLIKQRKSNPGVKVFDIATMEQQLQIYTPRDNLYRNLKRYLGYLEGTHGWLRQDTLPDGVNQALELLSAQFPNFAEAIGFYREQLALASLKSPTVLAASPLLLVGPPGVGKTSFCKALAETLGAYFSVISLSGITAGFVIGGMSSSWADGKPGRVVQTLAQSQRANPMILLDELDKTDNNNRYDPIGPLYQLLEHGTARVFTDEGLELPVDCSHILWIASANDRNAISEAILSRFTVIDIAPPTPEQHTAVVQSIYRNLCRDYPWGDQFHDNLDSEVVARLQQAGISPRQIQKALLAACGRAVLRQVRSDASYTILPADLALNRLTPAKKSIGFV